MNFLDVERDFVRCKVLPNFEWTGFEEATEPHPLAKPMTECKVALVVTAGAYLRDCLRYAVQALPAGSIVDLPYRWSDDLRERQLRKEAH